MTDSVTQTTSQSAYDAYALQTTTDSSTQLGQEDFLALMTAQVGNQDPLNPADTNEFFSQIAAFSQVSELQSLNDSMGSLAVQMSSSLPLQAAQLVGHDVLIASTTATTSAAGEGFDGAVETTVSGTINVEITNSAGEVIRTIPMVDQEAGLNAFSWDGTDNDGFPVPAGTYNMSATVVTPDGTVAATTYLQGEVQSVTFESEGMMLEVDGVGSIPFGNIREIS